ncbi:hypothetical protein ACFL4G_10225 [Thermodesulfobacteriota bacterium]
MSYRILGAVALMAIVLGFVACSQSNEEEYYPRPRDGERWEYKLEIMIPLQGVQSGKMVVRTDGKETIGDYTYFKSVSVISGIPGTEPEVVFSRWSSDGVYSIDGEHKDKPEYLSTPFPMEVGKTWTIKKPKTQSEYRAEAIETLELFDQTYENCLKIAFKTKAGASLIEGTMYHAKGIGLVKESGVIKQGFGGGTPYESTLEKYKR